jgi:ferredoxin-NADP reductase/DMSO/TMAO reductase YedYZ heme-binding membrane subunit
VADVARHPGAARLRPPTPRQVAPAVTQPAPRRVRPGLALGVIGAGTLAVIALWWHDTPGVTGLGDALTGAGRILGLLAGYGVVVLVTLMARLPPLERGIGTDRLARWHAMGGRYVISLIAAHAVAITWGYAVTAHEGVIAETGTLLTSYPDVLMATVAAFVLLGIGLVSARAARRRMAYETWYYLHFYTYIAIALAFSHQFADGASFVGSRPARAAWSALYLTVAGLVAWYRLITPVRKLERHRFRVAGLRPEAPGVVSVYIFGDHLDELRAEPGQFFRWRFLTHGLWWQSHPYSLSAMVRPDVMRITVKVRGDHSRAMTRLRPGTWVIAEGPYGAFTPAPSRRGVVLLAGGVGITPIRAMFAAMSAKTSQLSGGITLIYRASDPQDIVFRRELDGIAAARGATVHYLTGSRYQLGTDPLSARRLAALVPGLHRLEAYICGPPGMTRATVAALRTAGVPRRRIHYESFDF